MIQVEYQPQLHKMFATHCVQPAASMRTIESALLVGARLTSRSQTLAQANGMKYLSFGDEEYLAHIAEFLPQYGFSFAPHVDVRVANIEYDSRHDILTSAQKADLLVFCFVYYDPKPVRMAKSNPHRELHTRIVGISERVAFLQSPHADCPFAWSEAVHRTGAGVAVNIINLAYDGASELPTRFIESAGFKRVGQEERRSRYGMSGFRQGYDVLVPRGM